MHTEQKYHEVGKDQPAVDYKTSEAHAHTHTVIDLVLFQGDNWLYFPDSEAVFFFLARARVGIESCLEGPRVRWDLPPVR